MVGVAVAVGALAEKIPGSADEIRAPAWLLGLLAFGALATLLYVTTRFNRDR
jgi:hypothetical protein